MWVVLCEAATIFSDVFSRVTYRKVVSLANAIHHVSKAQARALVQVRDRAVLALTQLQGAAGGTDAVTPALDVNMTALESQLRSFLSGDTGLAFDMVSTSAVDLLCLGELRIVLLCLGTAILFMTA
jgi:hypothetical protein